MTARLVLRFAGWFREYVWRSWVYEEIAIVRKSIDRSRLQSMVSVREHRNDAKMIEEIHYAIGHRISRNRISQRLEQGLVFYEGRQNEKLVATTWMVMPGTRFIDEIGLHFFVPDRTVWVRDVFVSPRIRGRRIFSHFVDAVLLSHCRNSDFVWSDVACDDEASLQAHAAYGFEQVDVVKVLQVGSTLMLRLGVPTRVPIMGGFDTERRIVRTGKAYQEYKTTWLA